MKTFNIININIVNLRLIWVWMSTWIGCKKKISKNGLSFCGTSTTYVKLNDREWCDISEKDKKCECQILKMENDKW
jgi:hypothetical protein